MSCNNFEDKFSRFEKLAGNDLETQNAGYQLFHGWITLNNVLKIHVNFLSNISFIEKGR